MKNRIMKKVISILVFTGIVFSSRAQDHDAINFTREMDREFLRISATIFFSALFMFFLLTILKWVLEFRLKKKIVDKGVTDDLAVSILQTGKKESRHASIKWFALLFSLGIAFIIISNSLPLGFHSLAAICISIAIGFLGYFFYQKYSNES